MSSLDFLQRYEATAGTLPGDKAVRAEAAAAFRSAGFPGERPRDKNEAWKYTSLRPLAATSWRRMPPYDVGTSKDADAAIRRHDGGDADLASVALLDAPRIVFANGEYRPDLSTAQAGTPTPTGLAQPTRDPLVALNTMLATSGASLHVPAGTDGGTIQLVHIASADADFHPRHTIRLDAGASLTLIETTTGQGTYLLNSVAELQIADGARLTHIRLQNDAPSAFVVATTYADLGANAFYDSFVVTLGARLSRAEAHVRLSGNGGTAHLHGVQLLTGTQHADFTSVIDHQAYGCTSRQAVKNVLAGRSRGVFQGKIHVARAAQKTDGYQMSQALLLSPDAEIDTKPELEIYADDVKCSHGATVGELDPEQLFYLRSRGIPDAEARSILIRAFLEEAVEAVSDETIRAWLDAAIEGWWKGQTT